MNGHVVLVSLSAQDITGIAEWTSHWLSRHLPAMDPLVYVCHDLGLAERSIEKPLSEARPPSLIIINHAPNDAEMMRFSHKVRDCVPECWVVDLVERESLLPSEPHSASVLTKPFLKQDWESFLEHLFVQARTPQWSKAILDQA